MCDLSFPPCLWDVPKRLSTGGRDEEALHRSSEQTSISLSIVPMLGLMRLDKTLRLNDLISFHLIHVNIFI